MYAEIDYSPQKLKWMQEDCDRKMMENQCSLFDMGATAPKREGD